LCVTGNRRSLALGAALVALSLGASLRAPARTRSGPNGAPPAVTFKTRYVFALYGREDGLADLNVESLLQDRVGFLWVGTDDGLFRFDGRQFVKLGAELAALDSRVNVLHETKDGTLWAGTRTGLARREGERFVAVGAESGLPASEILDGQLASDDAGRLWAGTSKGLFCYENGRFRLVPRRGGSPETKVSALHLAPDGTLWVGRGTSLEATDARGTRDAGSAIPLPPAETIDRIETDRAGRLWVRTLRTLWRRDKGSESFVRDDVGLPASSESGRLALGDGGEIVVPTSRGLAQKEGGVWKLLGLHEGLPGSTVNAALVDREGSLFLGIAGEGLARRLGHGAFRGGGESEGLAHNLVWAIVREEVAGRPGALWVGTEGGLNRIDPADGTITTYREADGLGGDTVQTLAAGPGGRIYAGLWPGGVTRMGPAPGAFRRLDLSGLDPAAVRVVSLFRGRNGAVWTGTNRGLFLLPPPGTGDRFERVAIPGGRADARIYAFAEDGTGVVWAAGEGGLYRLTGSEPRRFGIEAGFRSPDLASLALLPDGGFAVGHREAPGVDRVVVLPGDRLTITPLAPAPGAPRAKTVFLGLDAAGSLWVGTTAGADVYPASGPPVHYGRSSGLLSDDLNQLAFLAERDGTVWFGTSRGLVHYLPGPRGAPRPKPPVVLLEAWAGGRRLDLSEPARLSRRERDLRISWAALTFVAPRQVKYRYRLQGFDAPWVETPLGEVSFSALPSGPYRFEVTATLADGSEALAPATWSFSVEPAWWQEWWAWVSIGLILVGVLGAVTRWRTSALEEDRRRLEAAVAERSAALAAANRELEEASLTDPLTGLRNRRFFPASIEKGVAQVLRAFRTAKGGPTPDSRDIVLYLVDLDHFKEINDQFGHDAGDRVLIEVGRRLSSVVRKSDDLIRWGGEEFLIVSQEADRDQAGLLGERILSVVSREPFDLGKGRQVFRTCSVGWAPFPWLPWAPDAVGYDEVLRLADRALLLAKRSGRHQAIGLLPLGAERESVEIAQAAVRQPVLDGNEQSLRVLRSLGPVTPE
jgi:diguanylate cyclase (GGDEF)-like protein